MREAVAHGRQVLGGQGRRVTVLAAVALAGGLAQALVLVLVVQISLAMATGAQAVTLHGGPVAGVLVAVRPALGAAAVLVVAVLVAAWSTARLSGAIASTALLQARHDLLTAYSRAGRRAQRSMSGGAFVELASSDSLRVGQAALSASVVAVAAANLAVLAAVALVLHPVAAVAVLVAGAALGLLAQPLSRARRRRAVEQADASLHLADALDETYHGARDLRTFGVTEPALARVLASVDDHAAAFAELAMLNRFGPQAVQYGGLGLLIAGLAVLTTLPADVLAPLGGVILLVLRATSYIQGLQSHLHQLAEARPLLDRVSGRERAFASAAVNEAGTAIGRIDRLEVRGGVVAHGPGRPALSGADLVLNRGEAVGLAGPSGAGKSTLADVLMRLVDLDAGALLVNGLPAAEVSLTSWYQAVALVPQDGYLIHGSIADNIAFLRPSHTATQVREAAAQAGLDAEIAALPGGYATVVGPGSAGLSVGQRQRLCIARALLGRPQLLVLDEPTAALDPSSREHVRDSLTALRGQVTMLVVSHQADTLQFCDRVLDLVDGRVSAGGPALPAGPPHVLHAGDVGAR